LVGVRESNELLGGLDIGGDVSPKGEGIAVGTRVKAMVGGVVALFGNTTEYKAASGPAK